MVDYISLPEGKISQYPECPYGETGTSGNWLDGTMENLRKIPSTVCTKGLREYCVTKQIDGTCPEGKHV